MIILYDYIISYHIILYDYIISYHIIYDYNLLNYMILKLPLFTSQEISPRPQHLLPQRRQNLPRQRGRRRRWARLQPQ